MRYSKSMQPAGFDAANLFDSQLVQTLNRIVKLSKFESPATALKSALEYYLQNVSEVEAPLYQRRAARSSVISPPNAEQPPVLSTDERDRLEAISKKSLELFDF